jgi:hypothetical protein
MSKIFMVCLTVLLLSNFVVYFVSTGGEQVLTLSDLIIKNFITLGLIAILASVIPLTEGGTSIRWFVGTLTILVMLFKIDLTVLTYNVSVGVGLASNIINIFSDTSGLNLLPYVFFIFIGLLATISGIVLTSGGD